MSKDSEGAPPEQSDETSHRADSSSSEPLPARESTEQREVADTEVHEPLRTASGKVLSDADIQELADEAEQGYEVDDPKHPTFRERLSALWDARPGK